MRIPLFHINAFAATQFRGNPAAVCLLSSWLDDGLLRKVAAENNLSATAFLVECGDAYELRWFTPQCEVQLCGHATLATGYVVLNLLHPQSKTASFLTRFRGVVVVSKEGDLLKLDFPASDPRRCANPPVGLLSALRNAPSSSEVFEANATFLAVFPDQKTILEMNPDFNLLERLHPCAVIVTAPGDEVDFVSRYFAPSYGVPEDPVTGSAHCALAPYWAGRLKKSSFTARQLSERGGELSCELAGDRVILSGHAVLTMKGELNL